MYLDTNTTPFKEIVRPNWRGNDGLMVSDAYLAEQGIYPVSDIKPKETWMSSYSHGGYALRDGVAYVEYVEVTRTLEEAKQYLTKAVNDKRKQVEQGGVNFNGSRIDTDKDSQGKINGAVSLAQLDPELVIDFKGAEGWVKLAAPEMIAVGMAVARHIQACFTKERELNELIEQADSHAALEKLDITSGWPQ